MWALHAFALLRAVHALQLHVPHLRQKHGRHERLFWHAGLHPGQGRLRPTPRLCQPPPGVHTPPTQAMANKCNPWVLHRCQCEGKVVIFGL